ncbi:hypothetical protein [Hamadaea tsunoensis]|uniref:hypothetical protein n=1 Tax=Hamadaea tsunoensis TaxID=53368 RepID=UPI0004052097|nr:hypothetical protein [Hamadaea tsunoensis]
MSDVADRSSELLLRVAEFLKKLSPDKVDELLAGEARLEIVPKGARIAGPAAARPAAKAVAPVDAAQIGADLAKLDDRAAAARMIDDLKLKKPQIVALAQDLGVPVKASATAAAIRDAIVAQKVGSRLVDDAIMGRLPR